MKPLTIHAEAIAEVDTAAAYYESRRTGFGGEFLLELDHVFQQIQRMPLLPAPLDDRGMRRRRMRRFPYTVYYEELEQSIWIAAVSHQSRRPGYWHGSRAPGEEDT